MFKLNQQRAKLSSVNPRAELHGEETNLACDLKFSFTTSNTKLDEFDKNLRPALFDLPHEGYEEDLADQGTERDEDYRPVIRFPDLGKINWGYKGAGYRLTIHQGYSGNEDVNLIDCQIDKFKFDAEAGGSVEIEFRVIAHPNSEEVGEICELLQQEVDISLEPPSAERQAQMEIDEATEEYEPA